jgi:hypothetical protein
MHVAIKTASITIGALAMVATLAACSDSTTTESATTVESAVAETDREASLGVRSTQVCVSNSTSGDIGVQWSQYDSASGNGVVAGGSQLCAEGSHSSFTPERDVEGSVSIEGTDKILFFQAHNSPGAAPGFGVDCVDTSNAVDDKFEVGNELTFNECGMSVTVTRQADDDWINFLVNVTK